MSFPIGDWQFWIVSLIALAGLALVLKPLWPFGARSGDGCSGCDSGVACQEGGQPVE